MKIFISHASINKAYGEALVDLLRAIGINDREIIFTSNVAYGIPNSKNIFDWLKGIITEKPHVIYLLSSEYYESVACLNEMGAAWVVENDHTVIFTPKFNIENPKFQNGALDPREIGFYINNEDRILSFIEQLRESFDITKNSVLVSQKIKVFLAELQKIDKTFTTASNVSIKKVSVEKEITSLPFDDIPINNGFNTFELESIETPNENKIAEKPITRNKDIYLKFLTDIRENKLNDEELILIQYILDTSNTKLKTGWQEETEIQNVREWEDINGLDNYLSQRYTSVLRRLNIRKYTEVSDVTGSGNTKEVKLITEIEENILEFPQDILDKISATIKEHPDTPLSF